MTQTPPGEVYVREAERRLAALGIPSLAGAVLANATTQLARLLEGLAQLDELGLAEVEPATTYRPIEEV